ncbi:hypothetical protein [Streptomyces xanthochromogenes]|uniref:hypothetical protein n=1 Tax=Streptomyces xanthochromogenes TaxID=67384 RepID=UPI003424085B
MAMKGPWCRTRLLLELVEPVGTGGDAKHGGGHLHRGIRCLLSLLRHTNVSRAVIEVLW